VSPSNQRAIVSASWEKCWLARLEAYCRQFGNFGRYFRVVAYPERELDLFLEMVILDCCSRRPRLG
jgi:hypothetical protein